MCSAATKMDSKKRLASDSTVRLEVESRRMEEKLSVLRKIMSAEKLRREEAGGIHWQKGQKGPLHRRQAVAPPPEASKSKKGGRGTSEKPLRIRVLTNRTKGTKDSSKLPSCGQCDKSTASLSCLECVENYCTVCFAKFHHKGALSRHHVKPLVNKMKQTPGHKTGNGDARSAELPTNATPTARNPRGDISSVSTTADGQTTSTAVATDFSTQRDETVRGRTNALKASHNSFHEDVDRKGAGGSGSLLEGTYDEAEAAASFQKALAEWRAGGGAHETHSGTGEKGENTVSTRESSCSTHATQSTQSPSAVTTVDPHSLRVEFSSKTGVSYFERLMVRRHRVETVFGKAGRVVGETAHPNIGTEPYLETEISEGETTSALKSGPTQYNLFYSAEVEDEVCPALETTCSSETTRPTDFNFERPPSSVLIEVIDFIEEEPKPKSKASTHERARSNDKPPALNPADSKVTSRECSRRKKPHSAKRQATNFTTVKASNSAPTRKPGTGGETDVAASVRHAWSDSASQTHQYEHGDASTLSTFFLSGVQRTNQNPAITDPPKSEEEGVSSRGRFRFASTIWLPDSSSPAVHVAARSESLGGTAPLQPMARTLIVPDHHSENANKEYHSDFDINTDLPPLTTFVPAASGDTTDSGSPTRQNTTSACTYHYCDSDSSSECGDDLSLYDIEEAEFEELQRLQEWEGLADSEALEGLTSELGRITACRGEIIEERRVEESSGDDCDLRSLVRDHHHHQEVVGGEMIEELRQQQERADSEALESLTLELGRITRCQGELEEGD